MKSLIQFLTESQGAALKDRKWARFFGDDYGKDVTIKKKQWRTKKFLKDFKDDISEKSFDFLNKLAVLQQEEISDSRSSLECNFYNKDEFKEYYCNFYVHANNIPDSIGKKLHPEVVGKKFNLDLNEPVGLRNPSGFKRFEKTKENQQTLAMYSCDTSGFGVTDSLYIAYHSPDKEDFFKVFNYIADTLLEIGDDILSFHDDYKDKDAIRYRKERQNKK